MSKTEKEIKCEVCGFDMVDMTTCHSRCHNCGNEVSCDDVG